MPSYSREDKQLNREYTNSTTKDEFDASKVNSIDGEAYSFKHLDIRVFLPLTVFNVNIIRAQTVFFLKPKEKFTEFLHTIRDGDICSPNDSLSIFVIVAGWHDMRFRS